jgi:CheY-like chemotaxis protein
MVRLIRLYRPAWTVSCVSSGTEALRQLGQSSIDVVISDLRMPGIDGITLLQVVRDRYPVTARVVQSSQIATIDASLLRSLAHRVLPKPAPLEALLGALDWAAERRRWPYLATARSGSA